MGRRALIIANGEMPDAELLRSQLEEELLVVCADGGANTALELGIRPDAIVGDLDSVSPETLAYFHDVPVHEDRNQDSTDLEKAVVWSIAQDRDEIVIVGALGQRLDHTVGNLGVLPKFHRQATIRVIDALGTLTYVGREVHFEARPGDVISLVPLNRCEGITTTGLRYALDGEALELGTREGTSNVVTSTSVSIRVERGHLLLYRLRQPLRAEAASRTVPGL
jgi:thiamine pyrophosphokinase